MPLFLFGDEPPLNRLLSANEAMSLKPVLLCHFRRNFVELSGGLTGALAHETATLASFYRFNSRLTGISMPIASK